MQARHFSVQDSLPGYGYGFYENYRNSAILLHDGDVDTFTSQLSLNPGKGIGYFVSYNTHDDGVLRDGLEDVIYGHYGVMLTGGNLVTIPSNVRAEDPEAFTGSYVFAQRLLEGPLKSRGLFLKIHIKDNGNGGIKVQAFDSRVSGTYVHAGERLYINPESGRCIYFKKDRTGKQYAIINTDVPLQTLEKLNTQEMIMERFVRPFVFGVAAAGIVWSILQFLFRKNNKNLRTYSKRTQTTSRWLSFLIAVLGICIVLVMFTTSDQFRTVILVIIKIVSIAIIFLTLMMLLFGIKGIRFKEIGTGSAVFYSLLFCASLGAISYSTFLDLY